MNKYICRDLYDFEFRKNLLKWMGKIQDVFQEGRKFYHFRRFETNTGEEINSIRIEKPNGRIINPICQRGLVYFRVCSNQGIKLKIKNFITGKLWNGRLPEKYCYSNGSWPRYYHEYDFGFD